MAVLNLGCRCWGGGSAGSAIWSGLVLFKVSVARLSRKAFAVSKGPAEAVVGAAVAVGLGIFDRLRMVRRFSVQAETCFRCHRLRFAAVWAGAFWRGLGRALVVGVGEGGDFNEGDLDVGGAFPRSRRKNARETKSTEKEERAAERTPGPRIAKRGTSFLLENVLWGGSVVHDPTFFSSFFNAGRPGRRFMYFRVLFEGAIRILAVKSRRPQVIAFDLFGFSSRPDTLGFIELVEVRQEHAQVELRFSVIRIQADHFLEVVHRLLWLILGLHEIPQGVMGLKQVR